MYPPDIFWLTYHLVQVRRQQSLFRISEKNGFHPRRVFHLVIFLGHPLSIPIIRKARHLSSVQAFFGTVNNKSLCSTSAIGLVCHDSFCIIMSQSMVGRLRRWTAKRAPFYHAWWVKLGLNFDVVLDFTTFLCPSTRHALFHVENEATTWYS